VAAPPPAATPVIPAVVVPTPTVAAPPAPEASRPVTASKRRGERPGAAHDSATPRVEPATPPPPRQTTPQGVPATPPAKPAKRDPAHRLIDEETPFFLE
jgi:hypothetical protein